GIEQMAIDRLRRSNQRLDVFAFVAEQRLIDVKVVVETELVQDFLDLMLDRYRPNLRRHADVDIDGADAGEIIGPVRGAAFNAADVDLWEQRAGWGFVDVLLLEFRRPLLQGGDDLGHLHDGIHLLHRVGRAIGPPGRLGLSERRDLDLHHPGLRPNDVQVGAVGHDGVIVVHAVREQVARADAFAAVFPALPRTDRAAGDLADDGREDQVALEPNAALLQCLARDHKSRNTPLHVRDAEPLDLVADDAS